MLNSNQVIFTGLADFISKLFCSIFPSVENDQLESISFEEPTDLNIKREEKTVLECYIWNGKWVYNPSYPVIKIKVVILLDIGLIVNQQENLIPIFLTIDGSRMNVMFPVGWKWTALCLTWTQRSL